MTRLHIAYDERLLDWQLGTGHPTNPVRAQHAVELLLASDVPVEVAPISAPASIQDLMLVHEQSYVEHVLDDGLSSEWAGVRPDLALVAGLMFQGTVDLVNGVLSGAVRLGFSPQGAKHHAHRDHSSGFCVFNDFAWAATVLADAGHRVLYLDTDAHHGDGVEALTRHRPDILTASIHDRSIFPGTGFTSERTALNFPLAPECGDDELLEAVTSALQHASDLAPTVVLMAIGGDGHERDPLSSLQYTHEGYRALGSLVGRFVGERELPVLFGGAGGYRPFDDTPRAWVNVLTSAYREIEQLSLWSPSDPPSPLVLLGYETGRQAAGGLELRDPAADT